MNKYLLIYHKEDNDGVFSGALFYNFLKKTFGENIEISTFPADYKDMRYFENKHKDLAELHSLYTDIILTDISFTSDYMINLYKEFENRFIWCDHHAPIIKAMKGYNNNIAGIRNTKKSAILCVYEFLYDQFNMEKIPELFKILSAWDSFTFKENGYTLDYVRNINKCVTIKTKLDLNEVIELVDDILTNDDKLDYEKLYAYGKTFNDYDQTNIDNIIKTSGDKSWHLLVSDSVMQSACAIFHQGSSNSLMFKSLESTDIKHGIVFKHNPDSTWTVSLYNINEDDTFHCGQFLREKYNGGGHVGAAGCQITQEQFIKILKNKTL